MYVASVLLRLLNASKSEETPSDLMNEVITLKRDQIYQVSLLSRGSAGLQLKYRVSNDSIIEVTRTGTLNSNIKETGSAVTVNFQITALQPGNVTVTFFETRPWDKTFAEIVQKQINITIEE